MILIVDDYADMCRALQRLLNQSGYEALCAFSAEEAQRLLRDFRPNVIVMDDAMPEKSGLDLLREIKSDPKLAEIPVVVFSANNDPVRMSRAREIGATAWLVKANTSWLDLAGIVRDLHAQNAGAMNHN